LTVQQAKVFAKTTKIGTSQKFTLYRTTVFHWTINICLLLSLLSQSGSLLQQNLLRLWYCWQCVRSLDSRYLPLKNCKYRFPRKLKNVCISKRQRSSAGTGKFLPWTFFCQLGDSSSTSDQQPPICSIAGRHSSTAVIRNEVIYVDNW